MSKIDVSWENMTQEVDIDFTATKDMPLPEELDEHYKQITKGVLNDND